MQDINWDLVQFKYEFLGFSLASLAIEHCISTAVLDYNAKNWKQISLEQDDLIDISEIKSIDDVLNKLSKQTVSQTQAFSILKQKYLGPKFIELETILLHKAISIASNLKENDKGSASTLKHLVDVLTSLIDRNPMLNPDDVEDGDGDKTWEIKVIHSTEPRDEQNPKEEPEE